MKALSLWQPWASLMASGLKTIETRHWPTHYRGLLAIHAAKRPVGWRERGLLDEWAEEAYISYVIAGSDFPLGAIVALVELYSCTPAVQLAETGLSDSELEFGNFSDDRWAWITRNPQAINPPIPYRGRQGIFNIPNSVLMAVEQTKEVGG